MTAPKPQDSKWINLYEGEPELAGIEVTQFPEGPAIGNFIQSFASRHPAVITYYFWDGRAKKFTYTPEGKNLQAEWWRTKVRGAFWNDVDFTYGSDPHFKHHTDPRQGIR